jgi:HD-GYP domain-containing protein (c-di-GMP phosphodiesterase class II)
MNVNNIIKEAGEDPLVKEGLRELHDYDILTYNHSVDVCESAISLGLSYYYSKDRLILLARAALLHDIGKMKIPLQILYSSHALSEQDWAIMKLHPVYSATWVLEHLGNQKIASIVIAHHEKLDGSGYPFGLAGSQISLDARILAIADIYQALKNKRTYKQKIWSDDEILQEFENMDGIDIHVVEEYYKLLT